MKTRIEQLQADLAEKKDELAAAQKRMNECELGSSESTSSTKRVHELCNECCEIQGRIDEARRHPPGTFQAAERAANELRQRQGLPPMRSTFNESRSDVQSSAIRGWARSQCGQPMTPEDRSACEQLGIDPNCRDLTLDLMSQEDHAELRQAMLEKRILSGSGSTSGATLRPEGFVHELERQMIYHGPMLAAARILQTNDGNVIRWPTAADDNLGELLPNDDTEVGYQDPTFSNVSYGAYPYSSKMVRVPVALLEDSGVNLAMELGGMLGERLGKIINNHTTVGDDDDKPQGIVNGSTEGKVSASATAIASTELIDLMHSVDLAYRGDPSCGWMMHDTTAAYIRKLIDGEGRFLWSQGDGGLTAGPGGVLLGKPVWINNDLDDTLEGGARPILFGALHKYVIRRVRRVRIRRLVERYAEFDQEAFVAFLRVDGRILQPGAIKHMVMGAATTTTTAG